MHLFEEHELVESGLRGKIASMGLSVEHFLLADLDLYLSPVMGWLLDC